jgi:hypothetical protein
VGKWHSVREDDGGGYVRAGYEYLLIGGHGHGPGGGYDERIDGGNLDAGGDYFSGRLSIVYGLDYIQQQASGTRFYTL